MSLRKEMEKIIKSGKSVLYGANVYERVEDLPSEAELARGDERQEEQARQNIKEELRRLSEQLAILDEEKESRERVAKSSTETTAEDAEKATEPKVAPKPAAKKSEETK